ncbi:hypothetical protein FH972_018094 [Carpinus fangiana]|uniref:Uncharacterized protein n=1 Tax=Carpinus fangiana TaxID=176857 RepID=A0A5N6RPF7_9ROSI|nr:hypothetical protein FH972_018094 [Carpinus fangiana]
MAGRRHRPCSGASATISSPRPRELPSAFLSRNGKTWPQNHICKHGDHSQACSECNARRRRGQPRGFKHQSKICIG